MSRLDLIRERAEAYRATHPVRFVVFGRGPRVLSRHCHIENALRVSNALQARVVVRIADTEPMTVERVSRLTERSVERMMRRLERVRPEEHLDAEELPDADAAGEEDVA